MKHQKIVRRVVLYIFGLLVLAFGVAFSVNADLGVSSVNSLPFVVSLICKIDMGVCVVLIFSAYVLIQILLLRGDFKLIDLSQIFFLMIFGYFLDFSSSVLGDFCIPSYMGRLAMLGVSIALIACGLALYMEARFINMPLEALIAAISRKKPAFSFHKIKVVMDCALVFTSAALSYGFLGGLHGVREGTIISALCVGRLLPVVKKALAPALSRFRPEES